VSFPVQPIPPALKLDMMAAPLVQGSSTLFAIELMARVGVHRCPILNSERFVTGLITESMLVSLVSQVSNANDSHIAQPCGRISGAWCTLAFTFVTRKRYTLEESY
jgi:hypothetical protein